MFIVFEGQDGVGKTHTSKMFCDMLVDLGIDVVLTSEPYQRDCFPVRPTLQEWLTNREIHWHDVISPALCKQQIVVCDRSYLSTMVYQFDDVLAEFFGFLEFLHNQRKPNYIVWVTADVDIIKHRLAERGEDVGTVRELQSRYQSIMELANPDMILDTSTPISREVGRTQLRKLAQLIAKWGDK